MSVAEPDGDTELVQRVAVCCRVLSTLWPPTSPDLNPPTFRALVTRQRLDHLIASIPLSRRFVNMFGVPKRVTQSAVADKNLLPQVVRVLFLVATQPETRPAFLAALHDTTASYRVVRVVHELLRTSLLPMTGMTMVETANEDGGGGGEVPGKINISFREAVISPIRDLAAAAPLTGILKKSVAVTNDDAMADNDCDEIAAIVNPKRVQFVGPTEVTARKVIPRSHPDKVDDVPRNRLIPRDWLLLPVLQSNGLGRNSNKATPTPALVECASDAPLDDNATLDRKTYTAAHHLLLLYHSLHCDGQNCLDDNDSLCDTLQRLWEHVGGCRNGSTCQVSQCQRTKQILSHYRLCTEPKTCWICASVHKLAQHDGAVAQRSGVRVVTLSPSPSMHELTQLVMQFRLYWMVHAQQCDGCVSSCGEAHALQAHLASCQHACDDEHCTYAKATLLHAAHCVDDTCWVCGPARHLVEASSRALGHSTQQPSLLPSRLVPYCVECENGPLSE